MTTIATLDQKYQQHLFDAICACSDIQTAEELSHFVTEELARIIPHEHFMLAVGAANDEKDVARVNIHRLVNISFPSSYLQSIIENRQRVSSNNFIGWRTTGRPQFHDKNAVSKHNSRWQNAFYDFGLTNACGYGVTESDGIHGAYFAFGNIDVPWTPRCAAVLEMLAPHLYVAAKRLGSAP